ncbi:PLP-dependent transferase [Ceratobasidium sp. AG-I]|nr:PLP-dependent transferase [Ceratobasidium sp. AG-I]
MLFPFFLPLLLPLASPFLPSSSRESSTTLSSKGTELAKKLQEPQPFEFHGTFYDKDKNPNGTISLWYSENSLMSTELLEYFNSHFHLTDNHLKYRWRLAHGSQPSTIQALPDYFNAYFGPLTPVLPEHSVHGNSVSALFTNFIDATCNPGDGVLMTTPYYGYFAGLIEYPAQAKIVAAHVPSSVNSLSGDAIQYLRLALEDPSNKIRVILLCNPHNPLAAAYPKDAIIAYAQLAEEFNVHLLVDEVYALQVFPSKHVPRPTPFISILSLDLRSYSVNPSRVHVIGSPNKAFGAAGLMVGTFVSQHNPELVQVMESTAEIVQVSSVSDMLFTSVLSDVGFRDWFLEENRRRLSAAFEFVADWCVFHKLPFIPASAGVFFVVDMAPILTHSLKNSLTPYERTRNAFNIMLNHGVYPQPVLSSEDPHTTQFRIMFALPSDMMLVALKRIEKAFGLKEWEPSEVAIKVQAA